MGLFSVSRCVLALVSACSACGPQELSFSYSGSDIGILQAQIAASDWNAACGTSISVSRGGNIPLTEEPPGTFLAHGILSDEAAGATTVNGDRVVGIRFIAGPRGTVVLRHEFGHALGIRVHPDHGIMKIASLRTPNEELVTTGDCP